MIDLFVFGMNEVCQRLSGFKVVYLSSELVIIFIRKCMLYVNFAILFGLHK